MDVAEEAARERAQKRMERRSALTLAFRLRSLDPEFDMLSYGAELICFMIVFVAFSVRVLPMVETEA